VSDTRRSAFVVTFAAVYAAVYCVAVYENWSLFSYGPAVEEWHWFNRPASAGPTMFWYGWMATAAIAAAAAGLVAYALPPGAVRWMRPALAWVVPLCAIAAVIYLLRDYVLR
jgi:hypothetical protein